MKDYSVNETNNVNFWRKDEEALLGLRFKVVVLKMCGS